MGTERRTDFIRKHGTYFPPYADVDLYPLDEAVQLLARALRDALEELDDLLEQRFPTEGSGTTYAIGGKTYVELGRTRLTRIRGDVMHRICGEHYNAIRIMGAVENTKKLRGAVLVDNRTK